MEQPKRNINKDRKVLTNPKLQLSVTGFFVGIAALNILYIFISVKLFEQNIIIDLASFSVEQKALIEKIILDQFPKLFIQIAIFSALVLALSLMAGVLLLNHISGPAIGIKRFIDELADGNTSHYPLKPRKNDFLKEIMTSLNQLAEKKFLK